ncbi:T6SS immunity protein Tli4 family protein [Pseudoxanthomonas putridarboris]|uniref:T6SS immunity protein Tli4 family protein n=1 Tax=Pseudoxanthomonas putridarboris TaxID=752605 RepID=A0ABU9J6Z2_9GAMM
MLAPLLLALLLLGCQYTPTEKEERTVSELTSNMRTWGLGRFLVDVPSQWRYGEGESLTLYYGLDKDFETVEVTVFAQDVTQAVFAATLTERVARIGRGTNYETNGSMLELEQKLGERALLLRYSQSTLGGGARTHEMHLLVDDVYLMLKKESYEGIKGIPKTKTRNQVDADLKELAAQIHKVTDIARAGPGFVFGPIIIQGHHDHEVATIDFYDPQRLDMTFEVGISAMTPDSDERLLQRGKMFMPMFEGNGSDLDTLRKGKREIAGMKAEEQLIAAGWRDQSGEAVRGVLFAAETYRPTPGLLQPTFSLKLDALGEKTWKSDAELAGAPQRMLGYSTLPDFASESRSTIDESPPMKPSMTEYEATAVWDAILKSIRPRPGAVASPSPPPEPPRYPRDKAQADQRALDAFLSTPHKK